MSKQQPDAMVDTSIFQGIVDFISPDGEHLRFCHTGAGMYSVSVLINSAYQVAGHIVLTDIEGPHSLFNDYKNSNFYRTLTP